MTDAELQAQIDEALDVTPAPDFRARVHARIAREPETPPWWMPRAALGGCLAGAVFVLSLWIMTSPAPSEAPASSMPVARDASTAPITTTDRSTAAPSPDSNVRGAFPKMGGSVAVVRQRATAAHASVAATPDATMPAATATTPTASSSSGRLSFEPAGTVRRIDLPEVIVPADQHAAVARFVALASRGAAPAPRSTGPAMADEPLHVPSIEIEPLTIEPLPRIARLDPSRGVFP